MSDNIDITTGMDVYVAKSAYPDKTRIGLGRVGRNPSYSWIEDGDYWTQGAMVSPGNSATFNIVIDEAIVGGSITMTL